MWHSYAQRLFEVLTSIIFTDKYSHPLPTDEGFALWQTQSDRVHKKKQNIFLIGNGASSTMASHFAADLGKNARFRAQVFTDAALLTAVGNDTVFDNVFAEPLGRFAQPGDMLVAISSSGNSPNILKAITAARQHETWIMTLSGMNADNALRQSGDLNCWVDAPTYALAETAHTAILHFWTDALVKKYNPLKIT